MQANLLKNVDAKNAVIHSNSKIELDGVESANNSVTAKHEFKLNGKLPEDQVINDEDKHDKEIDPTDDL